MSSQTLATPLPGVLPASPSPGLDLPDLDPTRWPSQMIDETPIGDEFAGASNEFGDGVAATRLDDDRSPPQQHRQALNNLLAALAPNSGPTSDATNQVEGVTLEETSQITAPYMSLAQNALATDVAASLSQPEPEPLSSNSNNFPPIAEWPPGATASDLPPTYPMDFASTQFQPFPRVPGIPPIPISNSREIEAFAKIEFEDGNYYLTTYACELGRDALAYRAAQHRAEEAALNPEEQQKSSSGRASERIRRGGDSQVQGSVISNAGGFGGVDDDPTAGGKEQDNKGHPSHSSQVSSSDVVKPQEVLYHPPLAQFDYHKSAELQAQMDPENELPAPVTSEHVPSADICPLVPIHATANSKKSELENHRAISRRHVRIEWNESEEVFYLKALGRNGAFLDDKYVPKGTAERLRDGSKIQISNIEAKFRLPRPTTEPVSDISVGEDGDRASARRSTSATSIDSETGVSRSKPKSRYDLTNEYGVAPAGAESLVGPDGELLPPRKRGPGRPPKDGIMSTRERKEREKAAKVLEAKSANGGRTPPPSAKPKFPNPKQLEILKVDSTAQKRPYKKRKREGEDDEVLPSIEGGEESILAEPEKLVVKKARASKSPSPEYIPLNLLTEEQLARPSEPYATLIFDILSDIYPRALPLKQIYRALKVKFPFFVYRVESEGWQSSVRHNLNQEWNKLFEKGEKEGKGFAWKAIPGAKQPQAERKRANQAAAAARPKQPPPPRNPPQQQSQQPPLNWQNSNPYGPPPPGWQSGPNGLYPPPLPNGLPWPPPPGWQPAQPGQTAVASSMPPNQHGLPSLNNSTPHPGVSTQRFQQPSSLTGTPQPPSHYAPRHGIQPGQSSQHNTPQPHQQSAKPGSAAPNMPCTLDGLMAIRRFENAMYDQVARSDKPNVEYWQTIFSSVKNRLLHGAATSNLPSGETKEEVTIMTHVRAFIEKFRNINFVGFKPNSRTVTPAPASLQEQVNQTSQAPSDAMPGGQDHTAPVEVHAGVNAHEVDVKAETEPSQSHEEAVPASGEHTTAISAQG